MVNLHLTSPFPHCNSHLKLLPTLQGRHYITSVVAPGAFERPGWKKKGTLPHSSYLLRRTRGGGDIWTPQSWPEIQHPGKSRCGKKGSFPAQTLQKDKEPGTHGNQPPARGSWPLKSVGGKGWHPRLFESFKHSANILRWQTSGVTALRRYEEAQSRANEIVPLFTSLYYP